MGSRKRDRAIPRSRTVLLCGMMGSGKTSVGRLLARRLEREFIDTDVEIERVSGTPIPAIFERCGESGFRRLERDVLAGLPQAHAVVALGGGALLAPENCALLASKGALIWLEAKPEALRERIGEASGRPLLAGLDRQGRLERLSQLCAEREPSYASAELRVATDGLEVEQVCRSVLRALGWENES